MNASTKQSASMNSPAVGKKHLLPARTEPAATDLQQLTYARFKRLRVVDKQWVLAQGLATLFSALVAIASILAWIFTPRHRNCDGFSPFSRALLSAFYSFAICIFTWSFAYELRVLGKKLDGPNPWTLEERRTRRGRGSICLIVIAACQVLSAIIQCLTAYRTSKEPLGLGAVPVVAGFAT